MLKRPTGTKEWAGDRNVRDTKTIGTCDITDSLYKDFSESSSTKVSESDITPLEIRVQDMVQLPNHLIPWKH